MHRACVHMNVRVSAFMPLLCGMYRDIRCDKISVWTSEKKNEPTRF